MNLGVMEAYSTLRKRPGLWSRGQRQQNEGLGESVSWGGQGPGRYYSQQRAVLELTRHLGLLLPHQHLEGTQEHRLRLLN